MSATIFGSNTSEQRWVDQLNEHFVIYVDNGPSIFHVPDAVRDTNPEAYTPQQVGIGAYHHFRIDNRKLGAVKKFLNPKQYANFKGLIVDKLKEIEPAIRSCYDKYLDLDGDTLAWIMAIDGVYLLHLLSTYAAEKGSIGIEDRSLARDIMMSENQMPCIVLKEIRKALLQPPPFENENEDPDENVELFSEMLSFCKAHTPLALSDDDVNFIGDKTTTPHLLDYMHTLIMRNWSTGSEPTRTRTRTQTDDLDRENEIKVPLVGDQKTGPRFLSDMYDLIRRIWSAGYPVEEGLGEVADEVTQFSQVAANLTGRKTFMLLANLPLQQFADLSKQGSRRTNSSISEEIEIPSASEIHRVCKIQLRVWPDSGIRVMYDEKNRILYLPEMKLNADSEAILRNLVAYEVALGSSSDVVVAGYVDFMCGIIDTAEDVDLLKERAIVKADLPSAEIARIFNGIRKSTRMMPDLAGTVEKLKMIDDNIFSVKARRFINRHFVPSKAAVNFFLATSILLLLTLQAFCQIYGCSARSFGKMMMISSI